MFKSFCGEYLVAKELFEELLAKEQTNRTLRESLAYCTVMTGDINTGIDIYESLIAENSEDGILRETI